MRMIEDIFQSFEGYLHDLSSISRFFPMAWEDSSKSLFAFVLNTADLVRSAWFLFFQSEKEQEIRRFLSTDHTKVLFE